MLNFGRGLGAGRGGGGGPGYVRHDVRREGRQGIVPPPATDHPCRDHGEQPVSPTRGGFTREPRRDRGVAWAATLATLSTARTGHDADGCGVGGVKRPRTLATRGVSESGMMGPRTLKRGVSEPRVGTARRGFVNCSTFVGHDPVARVPSATANTFKKLGSPAPPKARSHPSCPPHGITSHGIAMGIAWHGPSSPPPACIPCPCASGMYGTPGGVRRARTRGRRRRPP